MADRATIENFIQSGIKNELVDFKRDFYCRLSTSDVAKDVVAFANCAEDDDKYIIFGINDDTRELIGIQNESVCSIDALDNYLYETIEPHIRASLGTIKIGNKLIAYIKIHAGNQDRPYIIKKTCGKANKIERGDVYIRKGTCNQKACRMDLDAIYARNGKQSIALFDDYISVAPIYIKGEFPEKPTFGMAKIEIANLSNNPQLICGGYIDIKSKYGEIHRPICSILPHVDILNDPLQITPNSRKAYDILFDFLSDDCLLLRFDEDGHQLHETVARAVLINSENGELYTENRQVRIFARGDVLHKIKRYYEDMRSSLKSNIAKLEKSIESKDGCKGLLQAYPRPNPGNYGFDRQNRKTYFSLK